MGDAWEEGFGNGVPGEGVQGLGPKERGSKNSSPVNHLKAFEGLQCRQGQE